MRVVCTYTLCAYIFAGPNFCGLQIYTVFADFIFANEGLFIIYIVYIHYRSILIQ